MTIAPKALICGVSGQDGAWLASLLISRGYEVHGTSRDAETREMTGLSTLGILDQVQLHSMNLTDFRSALDTISRIQPDEIYNLAGQSSVGLSFEQPAETLESIAMGTLNLLDVVRLLGGGAKFYNASSSECFGETSKQGADEATAFHPRSPYAVAKAAAHWQVASYRDSYGLFACSGILFNHESFLRPSRFVTQKIVTSAVNIYRGKQEVLRLGNLDICRDWGWAGDYVDAMWRMLQSDTPADFVIATGHSHSLRSFVEIAFDVVGLDYQDYVVVDENLMRRNEIVFSCGNPAKAEAELAWTPHVDFREVVRRMMNHQLDKDTS